MKKRHAVWFIAVTVGVGVIVGLGYNFWLSRQELTFERTKRIFLKYETELTVVAEYVSEETRWNRYLTDAWNYENTYTNADFLPEQIKKYMTVYFKNINKTGSIYGIYDETKHYLNSFNVEPHGATGAIFLMYSGNRGRDNEQAWILVSQYLVYLKSDNPELYLQQIPSSYFGSVKCVADNWYLVTTSNH